MDEKETATKCKDECKKLFKGALALILLGETYISLGGFLFLYLEECASDQSTEYTKFELMCFEIQNRYNATVLLKSENYDFFWKLLDLCNGTQKRDTSTCEFSYEYIAKWWLYTFTVCSTIGYGNTVPVTDLGKITTMLYSLPGIAITITGYTYLGKLLTNVTKIAVIRFEQRLLKHNKVALLNVKSLIFIACVAICNLLLFAWMASLEETENFRYFDAVYFAFITQTTIGFGDYYYHFEKYFDKPHLLFPSTVFFIVGLGLIAAVINSISDVSLSH